MASFCCAARARLTVLNVILKRLQLVNCFLLRQIERPGLFDKLLGGLQGPRLYLPGNQGAVLLLGGAARIAAP